ncbi:MAG: phage holin family protein [Burkholderiales bacterium]|nr:phage holin family protein [Burkholderiales bacterium]MDE2287119.1 phage holin family protein [Burkholderiales bacterium]MDE2610099.1 phage holin family protein [Burkholderiales bacterium]
MTDYDRSASGRPSLRRTVGVALEIVQSRLELIGIELSEEKDRLLTIAFLGLAGMLFGLLALITLTALVAVLFWDTYRWQALCAIALAYALAGLACAALARRLLREAPLPFEATLNEFQKDRDSLRGD